MTAPIDAIKTEPNLNDATMERTLAGDSRHMPLEAHQDSIPAETRKVELSSSPSSATLTQESTNSPTLSSADKGSDNVNPKSSPGTETTPKVKETEEKPPQGWPDRVPFRNKTKNSQSIIQKYIFWSELTLKEKLSYRREFLTEYLSEVKKCFPYVRKLFIMIYRISPWRVAMLLVLNIVNGLLPAMTLQTRGSFIIMLQNGLEKRSLNTRALSTLLFRELLATAADKINDVTMRKLTGRLNARLRQQLEVGLFRGFLELHISEMKDEEITLFFNEARRVVKEDGITMFTKQLAIFRKCTSIIARIAALASLTYGKPWPILSLTAALPFLDHILSLIPLPGSQRPAYYSSVRDAQRYLDNARSSLNRIGRDIGARPEILIFGARDWMVERFAKLSEQLAVLHETRNLDWRRTELSSIQEDILPMLHNGARALIYLVVAYQPDYFGMPISQLNFLETAVEGVFTSISNLKHSLSHALIHDLFRIRNLFECIDIKSKVFVPQNPVPYKSHPYGMKIEAKDLTFRYKADSAPVLTDVSFTIEPGQMVSIVGYNGSGKTTLIRLLTLLERPSSGNIYVNDIDVSEYEPQTLRTNMSILFQDFREKYQEISAHDNIAIGNSPLGDLNTVKNAAVASGAHEYIRSFASYYETRLRKRRQSSFHDDYIPSPYTFRTAPDREISFMAKVLGGRLHSGAKIQDKQLVWGKKPAKEDINIEIPEYTPCDVPEYIESRSLSGGQWQRIALARAFMKIKEADLLILDEPSSALDPQAEYQVFKTLMELRKNRTTIFIVYISPLRELTKSHRFHTVRAASKIMLFDKGKLAEMGTHDELVQIKGGKYAHLFRLQSEGYADFNEEK